MHPYGGKDTMHIFQTVYIAEKCTIQATIQFFHAINLRGKIEISVYVSCLVGKSLPAY